MASLFAINEHPVERVARVGAGVALVALAATGTIGVWGYIGALPIATGLLGVCPIYSLFGISTCPTRKRIA